MASASADTLLPEDHTILWPLKFSDARDEVFGSVGDGFCNAPGLVDDKILDTASVQSIFAQAFNAQGASCASNDKLADLIFERSAADLLDPQIPLIQVFGIPPSVCDPALWKVVALRADPCQNIIEHRQSGAACKHQMRLVLQPFEKSMDGLTNVLDFTLHLIFNVPDIKTLRSDLQKVAAIARASEQQEPWEPQYDGKPVFRPHHGLRNELDRCGGPVTQAIKSLISRHALRSNLTSAATMGSNFAVKEWTFSAFRATPDGSVTLAEVNGATFDNFSDSLFAQGQYSMNKQLDRGTTFPTIREEITMAAARKAPKGPALTASYSKLHSVLNPLLMSQLASNCASCHLTPQVLQTLEELSGTPSTSVPEYFEAPIWHGFQPNERSSLNLRNLGYGPGFSLSLNRRTINEVMVAQQWYQNNP